MLISFAAWAALVTPIAANMVLIRPAASTAEVSDFLRVVVAQRLSQLEKFLVQKKSLHCQCQCL
jgi:hypothetical protein